MRAKNERNGKVLQHDSRIKGQVDVFSFFLAGPSSSPLTLGLGLGLGFGFGFSSSSTSIASFSSSFFGLGLALGLEGFFFGASSASLPSACALAFFLVSFFPFADLVISRSPLASDAVTPPPDSSSLSLGDPSSVDDAWKSSST